jgi:hypothetical protein
MIVSDQIERIRTMIRDPNGDIWTNQLLIDTYNDIQKEVQVKTGYLQNVSVVEIPPAAQYSHMHDWEWQHIPSEYQDNAYRCMRYSEQGGFCYSYQFEAEIYHGGTGENSEEGMAYTHPWESFMEAPNIPARLRFPSDFHSMLYIAYDREPVSYSELGPIQNRDQSYVNTSGRPICYYRVDNLDSEFVLYPQPTAVFVDDVIPEIQYVFTHSWEDGLLAFEGEMFGRLDEDNERTYIYNWELENDDQDDEGTRAMFAFELGASLGNIVMYVDGELADVNGVITERETSLLSSETGFDIEVIDDENNIFMAYKSIPTDIETQEDESDFPIFLRKYIEHGVSEQCFMANTDGQIASLAEYWGFRYMHGINVIKRFMSKRKQDRTYQFGTQTRIPRNMRHPRLPSNYPVI